MDEKPKELKDHSGYLRYAVENCLIAFEELGKVNGHLLKKISQHEPINIQHEGSLNRIIQDYLILKVAGLFDEDSRTASFHHEFCNIKKYKKIRKSNIIKYIIKLRHKKVAHADKNYLFKFPTTSIIISSNLRNLLNSLLDLLEN